MTKCKITFLWWRLCALGTGSGQTPEDSDTFFNSRYSTSKCSELACKVNWPWLSSYLNTDPQASGRKMSIHFAGQFGALTSKKLRIQKKGPESWIFLYLRNSSSSKCSELVCKMNRSFLSRHDAILKGLGHEIRIRFKWYGWIGLGKEKIRTLSWLRPIKLY
jgi:hypothetical protein